jgi:hypothetical protein
MMASKARAVRDRIMFGDVLGDFNVMRYDDDCQMQRLQMRIVSVKIHVLLLSLMNAH